MCVGSVGGGVRQGGCTSAQFAQDAEGMGGNTPELPSKALGQHRSTLEGPWM